MAQLDESVNMPFDEMIASRTKAWKDEYDLGATPRLSDSVVLTFRKRGDYFGYFYTGGGSRRSMWRSFPGKGMVTYPIIGRSIRSKIATSVATKVQVDVEAVRDLPDKQAGSEIARSILRFEEDRNWTKFLEATIAELAQIQRYCWLYNDYKKTGGMLIDVPVTKQVEKKSGQTVYNCQNCGFEHTPESLGIEDFADEFKDQDLAESNEITQPQITEGSQPELPSGGPSPEATAGNTVASGMSGDPDEWQDEEAQKTLEHTASLSCPDCGASSLVLADRARHEMIEAYTGEYEKCDTGFFDTQVISPLLTRIDSYPCPGFSYKHAGWFNYHPLVPLYELIAMAPQLAEQMASSVGNWSEQARWHYELSMNTSTAQGFSYRSKTYRADELVEPDVWWIAPHACHGWENPADWSLNKWAKDATGKWVETNEPLFTIREGETIQQAMERETGQPFEGAMLVMFQDKIIGIGNQFAFPRKFTGIPWKIDAQSFFPQGEENLNKLQDAATNVLSMVYSYVQRFATAPLVADPMGGFPEAAVEGIGQPGRIIYRKPLAPDVSNQDWKHYLGFLEPGTIGAAVFQFIQLIIEVAKEESGVFNETVGNVENQETLGGRRIALTQSLSLMTPTQQAKAMSKIDWAYSVIEHWQKDAPDEAFELIKGTYEEEWKPEDIAAFKALDLEREVAVTVVEGTDVPRTQIEMEQRYFTALQLGLFLDSNPLPIEIRSHIVKSVLGIDFDLGNYDAYKRLAATRYQKTKQEMAMLDPRTAFTIVPDPVSGYPVRQLRPEITASLMQDVRTGPQQTDSHLVFIEYYTDQLNGLLGAKEPDEIMIEVMKVFISAHRAFVAQTAVQGAQVQALADNAGQGLAQPQLGDGSAPAPQPGSPAATPAGGAAPGM